MRTVIVDWLGRGGIAQTTEAWALELMAAGRDVAVVTRPARELGVGKTTVIASPSRPGRVLSHEALARCAAAIVRESRPEVIVVQNYVVPALERPVYRAAAEVGARVVLVVHDHRLHSRAAGFRSGLRSLVRRADVVVSHTEFVARELRAWAGRSDVQVVPHPVQIGMLAHDPVPPDLPADARATAVHFGVLRRSYKGTDLVLDLAKMGVPGWRFVIAGVGAPAENQRLAAFPGFRTPGELVGLVEASAASLLPYRFATQSGAVVLSQVLGSVPVATAVGGIPEQIEDGVTGRLLPIGANANAWADVLVELADAARRADLARAANREAWSRHRGFVAAVLALTA